MNIISKKLKYEDFSFSNKELKERINEYESLKLNYKAKSGLKFDAKEIKDAFKKAVSHGK